MSQLVYFGGGSGGANQNLDNTYQVVGEGSDGAGTVVQAHSSVNTKGSAAQLVASTAAEFAGFWLWYGAASTSAASFLVDLKVDGVTIIPNLPLIPAGNAGYGRVFIPLRIAAGSKVEAVCQSNTSSASLRLYITGPLDNDQSPPLYGSMVALASVDTGASRASSIDVTVSAKGSPTYAQIIASTADTYGAFLIVATPNASSPTAQSVLVSVAAGGSGSEVPFGVVPLRLNNTDPKMVHSISAPIEHTIPAGSRISLSVAGATTGDTFRGNVYGFKA